MIRMCIFILLFLSCSKQETRDLSQQSPKDAAKALEKVVKSYRDQLLELHPQENLILNNVDIDEWNDRSNAIILRMMNIKFDHQKQLLNTVNQDSLTGFLGDLGVIVLDVTFQITDFINTYWYYLEFDLPQRNFTHEFTSILTESVPLEDERDVSNFIRLIVDTKRKLRSLDKRIEIRQIDGIPANKEIVDSLILSYTDELERLKNGHPVLEHFKSNSAFLSDEKQQKYTEDVQFHLENTYGKYIGKYVDELKKYAEAQIDPSKSEAVMEKLYEAYKTLEIKPLQEGVAVKAPYDVFKYYLYHLDLNRDRR